MSRSYVALSNCTAFWSFSLTLPLLHFFFFERPPAIAALSFASLLFCTAFCAPMASNEQRRLLPELCLFDAPLMLHWTLSLE